MLKQRQCEIFPHKSDRSVHKQDISEIQFDSVPVSGCKNTDFDIDFVGLITKNDEINNSLNSCLGNKPVIQISSAKSNSGNGVKCYRSKSVSPSRLTVPHPFKMTLRYVPSILYSSVKIAKVCCFSKREEKEHTMNELFNGHQHFVNKEPDDELKVSTTHSIPLTSRIPLYDRIVAEKAHK